MSKTEQFTILEPQNQGIDVSELHKVCPSPDFKALKLYFFRSGGACNDPVLAWCMSSFPTLTGHLNVCPYKHELVKSYVHTAMSSVSSRHKNAPSSKIPMVDLGFYKLLHCLVNLSAATASRSLIPFLIPEVFGFRKTCQAGEEDINLGLFFLLVSILSLSYFLSSSQAFLLGQRSNIEE